MTSMFVCYDADILFYTGMSIGLWIASMVGCALSIFTKRSYAEQIEEMMFEHIVQQLRGINMMEAYEQEDQEQEQDQEDQEDQEQEQEDQQEQEQEDQEQEQEDQEDQEQESEESEESEQESEESEDIVCVDQTVEHNDLPDLVQESQADTSEPTSESSDDMAPPSKRPRRGRGRGRCRSQT